MANKRYDQFPGVTPTTSRIILHADAATGALGKCTIADELALQTPTALLIDQLNTLGSPIKSVSCGINPIFQNSTVNLSALHVWWFWNYLPACTVTGVWYQLSTPGVFTGNNFNGFAIYSSGATNYTLLRQTANDPNFFKGTANTLRQAPFTSTVTVTAGNYWFAMLWCQSALTTTPAMRTTFGVTPFFSSGLGFSNNWILGAETGSTGSFNSTQANSSLPNGNMSVPICGFY